MSLHQPDRANAGLDLEQSIMLVVGAHPHAELFDRTPTECLRQRIMHWQAAREEIDPLDVLLVTDLWYLNDATMMARPTIAVGRPGVNAATAFHANRLPPSFAVEDFVHMHFDPEFIEPVACIWGRNEESTGAACDLFADRYLAAFMHSVHLMPAGES